MTSRSAARLSSALRLVFRIAAGVLALGLAAKAALDVSWPWDVWYYHLPFAARIWGILPRSVYILTPLNEARFSGYPLLAEALQGFLWRVTGRPESANFVALGSFVLLVLYAWRRLDVPLYISTIALLAIPHVQMHATACYIDLPANAALAVAVMEAWHAYAVNPPTDRALVAGLVAAAIAANMRLQLEPIVLVVLIALAVRLWLARKRPNGKKQIALLLIALPLIFAWPIKNLVVHHNPAYPVALHVPVTGEALPSAEEPYDSAPAYLQARSRPYRWLMSLAEVGIRPLAESRRWTIDQYMPDETGGNRIGGFFGAYVLANVLALLGQVALALVRSRKDENRERRIYVRNVHLSMMTTVALLSLICSLLPQSHELRYYMVWMLVLVLANLALLAFSLSEVVLPVVAPVAFAFLAVVLWSTEAWHVVPARYSFADLVHDKVDPALVAKIPDGGEACIDRAPWIALYAAPFHPGRSYRVREAETSSDCPGGAVLTFAGMSKDESTTPSAALSMASPRTSSESRSRSAQR